jgi:hypothetical protein
MRTRIFALVAFTTTVLSACTNSGPLLPSTARVHPAQKLLDEATPTPPATTNGGSGTFGSGH